MINRIALIGLGYLGKIHLKLLFENAEWRLVGVYDIDKNLTRQLAEHYNVKPFGSLYEAIEHSEVLDIVTPSNTHFDIARQAIMAGKHLFIEKPITPTSKEAEILNNLAKENGVCVQVGHVERFNPAFIAAKPYFRNPRFIEAHRLSQYTVRGTDVSVVTDLMMHDIDLLLSIVKDPIKEVQASGATLVSGSPDIVNARIAFFNGTVANLTASRLSFKNIRKFRVFSEDNFASVNLLDKITEVIRIQNAGIHSKNLILDTGKSVPKKEVVFEHPIVLPTNAIKEELRTFYAAINSNKIPPVSIEDAITSLKVAEEIEKLVS
ncbi:MAG: Gfo/Idh/MocA family oxidoreductase [Bacteroidia bacterium]|nr:Gfo/Idh/MocA family oxidoreductase [Bacteroidia bacterium]